MLSATVLSLSSETLLVFFSFFFFFFNDTATTEIYTLSLHDALPICRLRTLLVAGALCQRTHSTRRDLDYSAETSRRARRDRKSTRLNSSHSQISYAVFCLKKKKPQAMLIKRNSHQILPGTNSIPLSR